MKTSALIQLSLAVGGAFALPAIQHRQEASTALAAPINLAEPNARMMVKNRAMEMSEMAHQAFTGTIDTETLAAIIAELQAELADVVTILGSSADAATIAEELTAPLGAVEETLVTGVSRMAHDIILGGNGGRGGRGYGGGLGSLLPDLSGGYTLVAELIEVITDLIDALSEGIDLNVPPVTTPPPVTPPVDEDDLTAIGDLLTLLLAEGAAIGPLLSILLGVLNGIVPIENLETILEELLAGLVGGP